MEKLRISKIPADARAKEEKSPLSTSRGEPHSQLFKTPLKKMTETSYVGG